MSKCPLSYKEVEGRYDSTALKRLNHRLSDLKDLSYTSEELLREAAARADKLSIQGVQPKLSARLDLKSQSFELVDRQGYYIIKPPTPLFRSLPENEDCTMKLARTVGLEVPLHGLIYGKDGRLIYWIKRFDRSPKQKFPLEDFAQLSGASRKTKYRSSLEQVAQLVEDFCTFPRVESRKLLKLLLFCFLCGNEDQHLKNFSLLTTDSKVQLSPCYDLMNSTIVLANPSEESALTLAGKKSKLKRSHFWQYATVRLRLTEPIVGAVFQEIAQGLIHWKSIIRSSFLPVGEADKYLRLFQERRRRLGFVLAEHQPQDGLVSGSGEHQSFFRQLDRQRLGHLQCLTLEQMDIAKSRQQEAGGWQTAYARVCALGNTPGDQVGNS